MGRNVKNLNDKVKPTAAQIKSRHSRSAALAIILMLFVGLIYMAALVKFDQNISNKEM